MKHLFVGLVLTIAMSLGHIEVVAAVPSEPAATASGNTIPYKKEDSSAGASAGKTFTVLAVLLGLVCAGLFAARRYFSQLPLNLRLPLQTAQGRRLKIIETLRLNPKASLYLVQLDERMLLLAQSGDNITTIVNDHAVGSGHSENQEVWNNV